MVQLSCFGNKSFIVRSCSCVVLRVCSVRGVLLEQVIVIC